MQIVARLREEIERRRRDRLVDGNEARQIQLSLRNRGDCRRTAARARARAAVASSVARCGGLLGRSVIVCRGIRLGLIDHPAVRLGSRRMRCAVVSRAAHDPLRLAHEERHPERQRDAENPTAQRPAHYGDVRWFR